MASWFVVVCSGDVCTLSCRHCLFGARQASQADDPVLFTYDPPTITSVGPFPGQVATPSGGFLLRVTGSSFGSSPIVHVGDSRCAVNHTSVGQDVIVCTAPPRLALDTSVAVQVGRRVTLPVPEWAVVYEPPVLRDVVPNVVDAVLGGTVELHGNFFGSPAATLSAFRVDFGGVDCQSPTVVSDTLVRCILPGGMVTQDVGVRVTSWGATSAPRQVEVRCLNGFYSTGVGEVCTTCPTGATCAGMLSEPVAKPGFFALVRGLPCCSQAWPGLSPGLCCCVAVVVGGGGGWCRVGKNLTPGGLRCAE